MAQFCKLFKKKVSITPTAFSGAKGRGGSTLFYQVSFWGRCLVYPLERKNKTSSLYDNSQTTLQIYTFTTNYILRIPIIALLLIY